MAQAYISDHTTDYLGLKSRLLANGSNHQRSDHFDVLNRHLRRGLVTPGQLVIVPDNDSVSCSLEEAWLIRQAEKIHRDLEQRASAGAAVIGNYDLLQSLLEYGSIGIGSASSAWARHLDEVGIP